MLAAAVVLTGGMMTGGSELVRVVPEQMAEVAVGEQRRLRFEVKPSAPFHEVIPSWSASAPPGTGFEIEFRVKLEDRTSTAFRMGRWSMGEDRTSFKNEENPDGVVLTDTLRLNSPADVLIVDLIPFDAGDVQVDIRSFYLSFWSPAEGGDSRPNREAWGHSLPVPTRAQHDYPGGNVLCSPTSLSMLLNYWAERLDRPELRAEVPEIQTRINDPEWGGTGNWPFNTAFAGQHEGLSSYVTRLNSMAQLESLVAAGVPAAASISYSLLLGRDLGREQADDGHIIVVCGFTENGDLVINDPAKGADVRRIYDRKAFLDSWSASRRTIYLVHPIGWPMPEGDGPWEKADG